jgi:hypothetical protein
MKSEERKKCKKDENKTCGDCLHCKVCACSSKNARLCFCAMQKRKERDIEFYWLNKKPCKKFIDMTA